MPSVCSIKNPIELIKNSSKNMNTIKPETLLDALRRDRHPLLILDCRTEADYLKSHIRGSINVTFPSMILRRIATGKLNVTQVMSHIIPETADNFQVPIILYEYGHNNTDCPPNTLMTSLIKILSKGGYNVHCLVDGFEIFRELYPEWCETSVDPVKGRGLYPLRIAPKEVSELKSLDLGPGSRESSVSNGCDSSLGRELSFDDLCFPAEILPQLFLGNAQNSGDKEALNKHKIKYILNVTKNLPNVFEESSCYKYKQIPIFDHWSQNLSSFFPEAFQFIDEARESGVGVLVHCLAGISRSVTITVAYLMYKQGLSLEDAFEYVRLRKTNIDPNINFMGQLQDFQEQLRLTPSSCVCSSVESCSCRKRFHFMSPGLKSGSLTSPDSGITS